MKNITNLESGWAFIIAASLFIVLSAIFGGCNNYAPKGDFVVDEITQSLSEPINCIYYVKDRDIVFWDSCGKWNIGDTIVIKW
jgi:hypothetical protein